MKIKYLVLLILIIILGVVFRFGGLGDISAGLHADEASQGYNAFSLFKTGKDMYGKPFPILFRANGSYQPPVYTYLTTLPVILFGNTVFSVRFTSALSGSILLLITFLFFYFFGVGEKSQKIKQGILGSLVLAVSPWAIHFSRLAVEGNLVIVFFAMALIFAGLSVKNSKYFVWMCLFLGISTHVYYTERITSILFLFLYFIFLNGKILKDKKRVLLGLAIFFLILLPHLYIVKTGALTKRLSQVGYINNVQAKEGPVYSRGVYVIGQFVDHYLSYFSPKNLFFDPGQEIGRTSSDLSVFYPWFLIFVIIGANYVLKNSGNIGIKIIIISMLISPMPAGITGDLFYPLRVLTFLWLIGNVVALGFYQVWEAINYLIVRIVLFSCIFLYSSFYLYVSYFATSKYATSPDLGYSYIKLIETLPKYRDKKIIVDASTRNWGVGIRYAYLLLADPGKMQANLSTQMKSVYYNGDVNAYETFVIDNIYVKPIDWKEINSPDVLVVGDEYTLSEKDVKGHNLKLKFTIKNITQKDTLFGYSADPR